MWEGGGGRGEEGRVKGAPLCGKQLSRHAQSPLVFSSTKFVHCNHEVAHLSGCEPAHLLVPGVHDSRHRAP